MRRILFCFTTLCTMVHGFADPADAQTSFDNFKTKKEKDVQHLQSASSKESTAKPTVNSSKNLFFQTNIGIGFLRFSGVRGNLAVRTPPRLFRTIIDTFRDAPFKGRISYNRTPLFESVLGYQPMSWFNFGLSYQHQGGVDVCTDWLEAFTFSNAIAYTKAKFTSRLNLDAILFKIYFQLPCNFTCRNLLIKPYLAAGVGPGWQSWSSNALNFAYVTNSGTIDGVTVSVFPLSQKICANAVWMVDLGTKLFWTKRSTQFAAVLGCKYNQWGQTRNIGKFSQQPTLKMAFAQPLRVKTVYQFSPYLGVEWLFPNPRNTYPNYQLNGKSPASWEADFVNANTFQLSKAFWTQFNVGIGFLYFDRVQGNFAAQPSILFGAIQNRMRDIPLKGRLDYNRTPLFEYLIGYQFSNWIKLGFSYQYQSNITIKTPILHNFTPQSGSFDRYAQFSSDVSLNALLLKLYFESPITFVFKALSTTPYLAIGVGPGWQSWNRVYVDYIRRVDALGNPSRGDIYNFKSKNSANAVWMLDLGCRIQSAYPCSSFSVLMGCKYNQWGQARNIGKFSQRSRGILGFADPFRIRTVYQFAPYLGVQWSFANPKLINQKYLLKGKSPNTWMPYFVNTRCFQPRKSLWTQFNAAIGFLYFSGVRVNPTSYTPRLGLVNTLLGPIPLKGRLQYNKSPLFEYLLGYKFTSWFKMALSYQYQSGVSVQTQPLTIFINTAISWFQFSSNLSLNALLIKCYFELPFAFVAKNLSTTPYLATGVGPGWQTWSAINANYSVVTNVANWSYKQKISANAVWMLDLGFRTQSAYPNSKLSVLWGCKFNLWGQARNIADISKQGNIKIGFSQPLRIKTVYQWAPYLGVQWNF